MRFFILILVNLLLLPSSFAQRLGPSDLLERGEVDDQIGYIPRTLESLVGSAAIIVKGSFDVHVSHEGFYGYEDSRESLKERLNLSDSQVDRLAVPKSDYSISVDEVLLGDIDGDQIVYRIYEAAPSDRKYTDPMIDRLFFLVENPDGTYSPLGPASVLNLREGRYAFDALTTYPGEFVNEELLFLEGVSAMAFESSVKAEIIRQYGDQ